MSADANTIRETLEANDLGDWSEDQSQAAFAALDRIEAHLARAEQEIAYTRDRGDHVVYRDEWEAFDRWQRATKEEV